METTIHLPADVRNALAEEANRTGRPEAELIVEALRSYVQNRVPPGDRPVPRSFGMHADPELSGADSEDWLRANWRPA